MSRLGAWVGNGGVEFVVWAPNHARAEVVITPAGTDRPDGNRITLHSADGGYHVGFVEGLGAGARYRFALDGGPALPDPASRAQPDGVHGDSQVIAPTFAWTDAGWTGGALEQYVIYELHVGTFTERGTFAAAIDRLDDLVDLGVTAIELMPVAEFPGGRNWGYDGVFPYAAQSTYGGADGLRALVDAAHARGLGVVLDVVYNHLGPEGNVMAEYGPYFTDRYRTPWGGALNFDDAGSDEVRRFFTDNAKQWVDDFHIDALRLDAVHAIVDPSAYTFVEQLSDTVRALATKRGRVVPVIAESAANDARLISAKDRGGVGCDAQWDDDFHHALHALLTGEREGYYVDFGTVSDLARAYREGFAYACRFSVFRNRHHGRSAVGLPGERFVVFGQNHDQIGNRARGDRLIDLVGFEGARVAAAAVMVAPFVPLLFMGEEYGETNPFPYFVSHGDPELVEAVRRGRAEEFGATPGADPFDPQDPATFAAARLEWSRRSAAPNAELLAWYRTLLRLRTERPALAALDPGGVVTDVFEAEKALVVRRTHADDSIVVLLGFDVAPHEIELTLPDGPWRVLLDSSSPVAAPHGGSEGARRAFGTGTGGPERVVLAPRSVLVLGI